MNLFNYKRCSLKTRLREKTYFLLALFLTFLPKTADHYWQILKKLEWDYIDRDSRMGRYFHVVIASVTGAKRGEGGGLTKIRREKGKDVLALLVSE